MSESDMDEYNLIDRSLNGCVTGLPEWTVTLNASNNSSKTAHQVDNCTTFNFVFHGIVIGFLCLMGLAGNTVSMLVFQREYSNRVAAFLLQCLALADSFMLFVSLSFVTFIGWMPFFHLQSHTVTATRAYLKVYVEPFGYIAQSLTIWTTVLLAVNRYIAVCCPFIAYKLCTMRNAMIQVGIVVFVSITFNIPRFFQLRITLNNHTNSSTEATSIGETSLFGRVYTNALYTVLILVLPLVILLVLNTRIIKEMRSLQRRHSVISRSSSSSLEDRAEKNITIVMVIIIIVFLCCHTPDRVLQILKKSPTVSDCNTFYFLAFNICNFLVIFNSSVNFFIYYVVRKRFRRILFGLLPCSAEAAKERSDSSKFFSGTYRSSRC